MEKENNIIKMVILNMMEILLMINIKDMENFFGKIRTLLNMNMMVILLMINLKDMENYLWKIVNIMMGIGGIA